MEPLILKPSDPRLWEFLSHNPGVIFVSPTDTVYGLGTRCGDHLRADRILKLKGQEQNQLIMLVRSLEEAATLVDISQPQMEILRRYWPNAITFVLPSKENPSITLALRLPDSPFLIRMMETLRGPIFSTSCNRHGLPPVTRIDEAITLFKAAVDLYIDGGTMSSRLPSTVVSLATPTPVVLRPGAVPFP